MTELFIKATSLYSFYYQGNLPLLVTEKNMNKFFQYSYYYYICGALMEGRTLTDRTWGFKFF